MNFVELRSTKVGVSMKNYQVQAFGETAGAQLFDIEKIINYPYKYAGKHSESLFNSHWRDNHTMFDLINVFTEYTQNFDSSMVL
jgi:hypothetical protein